MYMSNIRKNKQNDGWWSLGKIKFRLKLGMVIGLFLASLALSHAKLKVVATTGFVGDLVKQVGGDRIELEVLMGPGVDPHLYKPTASDISRLSQADVIFYSGLHLEGKMQEIFDKISKSNKKIYAVTDGVPREKLLSPPEFEGNYDPHVWFDVPLWSECVDTVSQSLTTHDKAGEKEYAQRGEELKKAHAALQEWVINKIKELSGERRILVTSHDAYNYFGRAYGFKVIGIQGISTVTEAGLADMAKMVDYIKEQKVPAIFVESSVSPNTIRRVSEDAEVKIGGELFSDALGASGEIRQGFDVGTYEGVVKYNVATIVEALKGVTGNE
jgi:manganese/zinc/iron transport system substrate-binding protein